MKNLNKKTFGIVVGVLLLIVGIIILLNFFADTSEIKTSSSQDPPPLASSFETDFSKSSVDFELLLSGGPGKDGIPALDNPKFIPIAETESSDSVRGVLVEINGQKKFYPFNILVWHEIANDSVGGENVAVTFCPLCGSAVVFDPAVDGKDLKFRVSGLLYESNLVMYDTDTESFWSQSQGTAIVGEHTGKVLELKPFQMLETGEVKANHPDALVMSTDTGYSRNYTSNPYGNYDQTEDTLFPISVDDQRYGAKEIFYIVRLGDGTVAIRKDSLQRGNSYQNDQLELKAEFTADGEIFVTTSEGELVPGYFEMWFSWVNQNQDAGQVWDVAVDT